MASKVLVKNRSWVNPLNSIHQHAATLTDRRSADPQLARDLGLRLRSCIQPEPFDDQSIVPAPYELGPCNRFGRPKAAGRRLLFLVFRDGPFRPILSGVEDGVTALLPGSPRCGAGKALG